MLSRAGRRVETVCDGERLYPYSEWFGYFDIHRLGELSNLGLRRLRPSIVCCNNYTQVNLFAAGANQCATPTFSPVAGSYTGTQTVTVTSTTSGCTIYYTTDGTTPTESSSSISNGGTVSVASSLTLKAIASLTDNLDSAVGSAAYVSISAYSVPDCRVTKPNSATGETINGTILYDSQTSSNPAIPPTDSRVSKPVACGTYPQNSRTPGTYGPGE